MPQEFSDFFSEIRERKFDELEHQRPRRGFEEPAHLEPHSFLNALKMPVTGWTNVIVELQRRKPLISTLGYEETIKTIAADYDSFGVRALCVIGDIQFEGSLKDVTIARKTSKLPVVYMDFIVDERQLKDAYESGADAAILVAQLVTARELQALVSAAKEYKLDVMVEVCDKRGLNAALECHPQIIALNNRSWLDDELDMSITTSLAHLVPKDVAVVSASGFINPEQIQKVLNESQRQIDGVLVSKALMEARTVAAAQNLVRAFTKHVVVQGYNAGKKRGQRH